MIDTDDVKSALGLDPADTADDQWLTTVVAGVNGFVAGVRPDVVAPWPDQMTWGAIQLSTRWYARRNSSDVAAYVEMGGPPPAIDRDIEIALGINRYFGPAVS